MLSNESKIKVAPAAPLPVKMVASMMEGVNNPQFLRGPVSQLAYCRHRANNGPKIKDGWQENLFGYNFVTSTLSLLSGKEWAHYVYADHNGVSELSLMAWMYGLSISEWICFVNPPELQSQPHLPHGHVIAPKRDLSSAIGRLSVSSIFE